MCIMRVLILAMRDHNRRFADYLFFDECCKQAMSQPIGIVGDIAMFHQLSEGTLQKMLHTPGVTTSNKWPSGSRK